MIIGTVKELKADESRVGLTPAGVETLCEYGHAVLVQSGAGMGSGFTDEAYAEAGASIRSNPASVWAEADMIIKVKEPVAAEWPLIRSGQILFTYFHFAADRNLTEAILSSGAIAIAYETIQEANGSLPLLIPMSEVAGRMAIHQGAKFLEKAHGGRGILLGGVPGVPPATVVVLGAGTVGMNATKMAAGLGCLVYVLDVNLDRLRYYSDVMPNNVITMMSNRTNLRKALTEADLIVSSVLIPGAKAPKLIQRSTLTQMKPGAVIVDVAIDQGGSTETSRPSTHKDPIYEVDGVIHYCVTNMPGAMPLTSTLALTNATLPYALLIAGKGCRQAAFQHLAIRKGVNIFKGQITHQQVAKAFDLPFMPAEEAMK